MFALESSVVRTIQSVDDNKATAALDATCEYKNENQNENRERDIEPSK